MTRKHLLGRLPGLAALPVVALLSLACSGGSEAQVRPADSAGAPLDTATFAGGCFWCVEEAFDQAEGVVSTTSGYMGGRLANPTYEQVSSGRTGHAEVVRVVFDPARIGYADLLDVFWRNVDPLTPDAQFCDHGAQYRSAIFYDGEEQRRLATASKEALERSGRFDQPIVTEVTPASAFYPAEEYHQDYHKKQPVHYQRYRTGSGRAAFIKQTWGGGE